MTEYGTYLVIHLQACEHGVLKAHVHAHDMVHQRVGLVRLQGGRDGETCGSIAVQDVHQLLLLDGTLELQHTKSMSRRRPCPNSHTKLH